MNVWPRSIRPPRKRDSLAIGPLLPCLLIAACTSTAALRSGSIRTPSVDSMTLDQKIGQLFVVSGRGTFMNEGSKDFQRLLHYVRDDHVGGVIWFGADVYETAWATDRLQAAANIPLLVSADLESGVGMRFANTTYWPWAMAIGATGDPRYAGMEGRIVAEEARKVGINQVYAPVADVNNNPDNPVINVRSFGEDPAEVARFVTAFVQGVQSEGVLATAKHFPGHGDVSTDSHRSLPTLDVSRERLGRVELVPFRAAIAAGVDSVMAAHLSVPQIDPTPTPPVQGRAEPNTYDAKQSEVNAHATMPASLSPIIIDGLLRKDLGFDGLVVTDSLGMGGITDYFDPGEAAVRAIAAGVDQALMSPDVDAAIAAVKAAVESGRIPMARIDRSVRRILAAKRKVRPTAFSMEGIFRGFDPPEHRAVAEEIAAKSLTLVRETPGVLPLSRQGKVVELVIGDLPEVVPPLTDIHHELQQRLGYEPPRFSLDRRSRDEDADPAYAAASSADVVLVEFTVRTRSGAGAVAVPPVAKALLQRLSSGGAKLVAISFGNPYLIREVPFLQTYVAAWGVQPVMQRAAAAAIFGEAPISGHLPITIPGIASRGDGIVKTWSDR